MFSRVFHIAGFIAFALFGSKPLSGTHLAIFNPDIEAIGGKAIAMSTRPDANGTVQKLKKAAKKTDRMASKVRMGIVPKDMVEVAKLEETRVAAKQGALSSLLQSANAEVGNLIAQKQTLVQQIKVFHDTGMKNKIKDLAEKLDVLDGEIDDAKKRGREWGDELNQDRKRPAKRGYSKVIRLFDCDETVTGADDAA